MAKCFNRNSPEYKILEGKYNDQLVVDTIIEKWQLSSRSDNFPTLYQAEKYIENEKVKFSLKKKQYSEAILANLDHAGIISKLNDNYYINVTENNQFGKRDQWVALDRKVAEKNRIKLLKTLDFWGISRNSVNLEMTEKTYKVSINPMVFGPQDIIAQNNNKEKTHILDLTDHMRAMFPQLDIRVSTVKEAEDYFKSLTDKQKRGVGFKNVKSYYVNGVAYIIKGRVNADTAVEEVLHPFIDAVKIQKPELYNSLLREAKKMFPQLKLEIDATYSKRRGFNQTDRDLELVTQALSRHFNQEYESRPTLSWKQSLMELLQFILDVIQDMSIYLQGKKVPVKANMLRSDNTLSSLAKLLNNEALEFRFDRQSVSPDSRVRFSLTKERKAEALDLVAQASEDVQADRIKELTGLTISEKVKFEDFTVGSSLTGTNSPLVILDKPTHTYINIETGEVNPSVTTKIKGKLNDPENKYKINREIGDDFDVIMSYIATKPRGEESDINMLGSKMKVLKPNQIQRAVDQIESGLQQYWDQGAVVIPQVVITDAETGISGTIDLLVVHTDGTLQIVDLKSSKNSKRDTAYKSRKFEVYEDSVFYDPQDPKKKLFTTATQHSLQINTYRRILTNMGYEVISDSRTMHINVKLKGKKVTNFVYEGTTYHNPTIMNHFVDQVVPLNEDALAKEERADQADTNKLNEEDQRQDAEYLENDMYQIKNDVLKSYQIKLVTRRQALETLQTRDKQTSNVEKIINALDRAIADIQTARMEGTSDVIYDELLQRSIDEMQDFIDYINNPEEQNKTDYIDRVLAMEGVAKSYSGLDVVANPKGVPLGARTNALRDKLRTQIDQVLGQGAYANKGLINAGLENYVTEIFRTNNTNADLTEEDIKNIITTYDTPIADISDTRLGVSDLATSPDQLSQLLDKLYKRQVQKTLDLAEERATEIRTKASKLSRLSPGGKVDYSFMLNFDKDNNFLGTYVKKIGPQYDAQWTSLRYDQNGESIFKKQYIYKDNIEDLTDEDIAYNKELYKQRKAYSDFMRGEKVTDGNPIDGDFHRYTKEYKDAREKLMYFSLFANKENGRWKFKSSASSRQKRDFLSKYHRQDPSNYIEKDQNGEPTGLVKKQQEGYDGGGIGFVRSEFVEINTIKNPQFINEKYEKLMNPNPNDSLGQAQKEFYLMYVRLFEEDLLKKLPASVQSKMLGNSLVIKENFIDEVKREGNIVGKLTAKATKGFKWLTSTTMRVEKVVVDEYGNFLEDSLPIFYVGNTKDEKRLQFINDSIASLKQDFADKKIKIDAYKKKLNELESERNSLQIAPGKNELSLDMGKNLLAFNGMAQNYETMGEIKNTVSAIIKVMEKRKYTPSGFASIIDSAKSAIGRGQVSEVGADYTSNIVKRARKWVNMVYYDNNRKTRGFMEKVARGLVSYTSLTYVGLNWFGNINNYAMGRLNNMVEVAGGRYYDRKSYLRAVSEYNKSIPGMMMKLGDQSTWSPVIGGDGYKEYIPATKYEAISKNYMRMMDAASDIREQSSEGQKGLRDTAFSAAYMFQDSAEYNVQSKVGIAIMMSTTARNPETGEEMSYYDALDYNNKTGEVKLKKGFTELIRFNERRTDSQGNLITQDLNDPNTRYDVRNQIREVNKQIHGNYAYADRMVIQDHTLGMLLAQFHKWVVPGLDARFRKEYYNQNLGWVEGRYKSFINVMGYIFKEKGRIAKAYKELEFQYGKERADNKMKGMYRTLADFGIAMSSFIMAMILSNLFDDDEDESQSRSRLENALIYQFNRQAREFMFFFPVLGSTEQYMMAKSPIPIMRSLGELAGAASATGKWGMASLGWYGLFEDEYDIESDSRIYYQRGTRKGSLKLKKEWADALPLIYMWNRWQAYDTINDFFVK
jgi:hypothetical protein